MVLNNKLTTPMIKSKQNQGNNLCPLAFTPKGNSLATTSSPGHPQSAFPGRALCSSTDIDHTAITVSAGEVAGAALWQAPKQPSFKPSCPFFEACRSCGLHSSLLGSYDKLPGGTDHHSEGLDAASVLRCWEHELTVWGGPRETSVALDP